MNTCRNWGRIPLLLAMAGMVALLVAACGGGSSKSSSTSSIPTAISLVNNQSAVVVIGQTDFVTGSSGISATKFNGLYGGVGVDPSTGKLYMPDYGNNRVPVFDGIPTANGASAVYALGQLDLTSNIGGTSASMVAGPQTSVIYGGSLFVDEYSNDRVSIYSPTPTGAPGTIATVLGEPDKTSALWGLCAATGMASPETVSVAGGKVVVADGNNNRVLIWNSIPTTDGQQADVVVGQPNLTSCAANGGATTISASGINYAGGAWTDGTRLVVLDDNNSRVLIWNTMPTVNGQPADIVLGQKDFISGSFNQGGAPSDKTLSYPYEGVYVNAAGQLFVADTGNNRVLVWNSFPTTNDQPADIVLGQPDFATTTPATSQTGLSSPVGVLLYQNHVLVTDDGNNRIMVY